MAKFYGRIGYSHNMKIRPGVFEDVITEYPYYGDVIRDSVRMNNGDQVNDNLSVGNSISIVADAYARENFFAMKYVEWAGTRWTVSSIDVQSPRLILRLGGVYNGPTA